MGIDRSTEPACPRCGANRADEFRWCRKCGLDFRSPPKDFTPDRPVAPVPAAAPDEPYRYGKIGAGVVIHPDRLELTTGALWKKRTHAIPLRAITGLSVQGLGGHTLIVHTAGGGFAVAVGVGAASKIRDCILDAMNSNG